MKYRACLLLSWLVLSLSVSRGGDASPLQPGPKFDYSKYAFQPKSWEERKLSLELTPWVGRNVIFLTTNDTFDPGLMGIWVSRLDAGWDLYADLTGRKPTPFKECEGKATIAAVPAYELTCGAGCGYIGATGIELAMFYDRNYEELKAHSQSMPHYVFYEMGRNFYTFGGRHSCYITGFAVFMRYVCMDDLKCEDLDTQTRKTIEGLEPLLASNDLSFLDLFSMLRAGEKVSRIRDASGKVVEPSDQPCRYATAMMRLRRENGGDAWLRRFFREVATCPESNPDTEDGALSQGWYWLLCSSVAAQKDLSSIFAGDWKLPIADATRTALGKIDWKKAGLTVKEVAETVKPQWSGRDAVPSVPKPNASESSQPSSTDALPALIPLPRKLTPGQGMLTLGPNSRIVARTAELEPLARVLAEEILLTTGAQFATVAAWARRGEIILQIDPALKKDAYTLEVKDTVLVRGGSYQAVAWGTATFLQALRPANGKVSCPRMTIDDDPAHPYRGALIDLARKYHSPGGIEQVIELCRLYKIAFLQLHLTDDQLFMFPSTKFPQAGRSNGEFTRFEPGAKPVIKPYTLEELKRLEQFARDRGVCLVPEIDMPGHSGRLIADLPDVFGFPGNGSTLNIANPKTIEAVATLLNEVMDVFQSTPYVHLGADEVGFGGLDQTAEYKEAQAKFGIKSAHDLYCKFIADVCGIVAKRGKKAVVWEEACNADGAYPLPKDALVIIWSQGRNPNDVVKSGYSVVNATWTPLYIVRDNRKTPEFLFDWSLPSFGREGSTEYTTLADTSKLAGAQLCSWENSEAIEIQSMRARLAIVAERAWNPAAGGTFAQFKSRLAVPDAILDKLVHPIAISVRGTFIDGENTFADPLIVELKPRRTGLTLKYTLDNSLPNERWRLYDGPITVNETVYLRSGLFDDQGRQQGCLSGAWFRKQQ